MSHDDQQKPADKPEVLGPDEEASTPDANKKFTLEVIGGNVSEAMAEMKSQVKYWADRGRYNKIRVKRNGKPVLPDIPIGGIVAFEAATFFLAGPLRGAIVNAVGRVFFEVELINDADEFYRRGLEHFLAGDMDESVEALQRALTIDERYGKAHLQLGVLRKMQGRKDEARGHFQAAIGCDPNGDVAREAEGHLQKLG